MGIHPAATPAPTQNRQYRLLQPLDELIVPILGQAPVLYPSLALGTQSPHSISLTKPQVLHSSRTYTHTYPSGPCTPYATAKYIAQICDQYSCIDQFNSLHW